MELDQIVAILGLAVTTIITLVSLAYAIKQRNVVKREISKKRYLEDAQKNLNEAITLLRDINIPNIRSSHLSYEEMQDTFHDAFTMTNEILRASFDLKSKNIVLDVSYFIKSTGEQERSPEQFDLRSFIALLRTNGVRIDSESNISNFQRFLLNDLNFGIVVWSLGDLNKATERLLRYEEVYESISPDSIAELNALYEKVAEEILMTIHKPKHLEIKLDSFSTTEEIMIYLFEEILNYSHIAQMFSKVADVISDLTQARKELFLKIS